MPNEDERGNRARESTVSTRIDRPATIDAAVSSSDRVAELDSLRGLACLLIVLYHFKPDRIPGGWAGVDFFLILSGYLITNIILKYHDRPGFLRAFYIRRWLRICPLYYLTLVIVAVASPILPRSTNFGGLFQAATYTQNIEAYWSARPVVFSQYLTHTWSLAIEEQFYLIWPPILYLTGRRGVVPAALAVVCLSVWARESGFHWWLLIARCDGFALGAILAATLGDRAGDRRPIGDPRRNVDQERSSRPKRNFSPERFRSGRINRPMNYILVPTLILTSLYLVYLFSIGGISRLGAPRRPGSTILAIDLFGFSVVGLTLSYAGSRLASPLRNKTLGYIGKISYGVYMYHLIIIMLGDDIAERVGLRGKPFWREALEAAVFFGMAAVSYRYIERPILALKDRIPYGRTLPKKPVDRGGFRDREKTDDRRGVSVRNASDSVSMISFNEDEEVDR